MSITSRMRRMPSAALGAVCALLVLQSGPLPRAQEPDQGLAFSRETGPPAALTGGQALACEARSADGGRSWPCRFRLTRYDPASGRVVGELTWTSLGSVHEVRGMLSGGRLTFTETQAIRAGGAHLNVVYDLRVGPTAVSGGWRDPADGSTGAMTIGLPPPQAAAPPVGGLANGAAHSCIARSADGGRTWPCRIRFTRHNAATGRIVGELTWTGLNSVHVIEGQLRGGRLTFTETRAVRAGGAHLNVSYDMQVGASSATGAWRDPADGSRGSMSIDLAR